MQHLATKHCALCHAHPLSSAAAASQVQEIGTFQAWNEVPAAKQGLCEACTNRQTELMLQDATTHGSQSFTAAACLPVITFKTNRTSGSACDFGFAKHKGCRQTAGARLLEAAGKHLHGVALLPRVGHMEDHHGRQLEPADLHTQEASLS